MERFRVDVFHKMKRNCYDTFMILGIDEVGRGPWAGPLVMGAVVLGDVTIDGLTDSKKLTSKQRTVLDREIRANAQAVALGWVEAAEIDEIGLSASLRLATRRAVEQIAVPFHQIIIDGTCNFLQNTNLEPYVTTLKKADLLIASVSAASIVAKVARDTWMAEQDEIYPGYKFSSHVGYGTAFHRQAIEEHGVTPLHRLSFAPLAKYRSDDNSKPIASKDPARAQTTRQIGDASETHAAHELIRLGHSIIARNWKTKYCEIDIVSRKADVLYFTEVKHRKTDASGGGIAAITPRKLQQMKFAAELYIQANHLQNFDRKLLVIDTIGDAIHLNQTIEIV